MSTEVKNFQEVREFYDEFSKKQIITGVNLRHYYLFRKIVKSGLKKNHSLLEIGCGIGTLTGLLASYVKQGDILVTDISPKNIASARGRLRSYKNIEFLVSDIQDFNCNQKFDFIVLADVLEHIPKNLHLNLFHVISKHLKKDAVLFINIPHPKRIEFLEKYSPEKLQVIDQTLYAKDLIREAESNGLILFEFKSYSLFHKEADYIQIIFKMNKDFNFRSFSKYSIIIKKMKYRLFYFLTKFKLLLKL